MAIRNALASMAVKDLKLSVSWYEKLFGRPADSTPMPEVAEWKFPGGGWLQVYAGPERAGGSSCTLAVSNLDEESERAKVEAKPFAETAVRPPEQGASYNFNIVMKKTVDAPLRLPLEIRTTHGPLGAGARTNYGKSIFDSTSRK